MQNPKLLCLTGVLTLGACGADDAVDLGHASAAVVTGSSLFSELQGFGGNTTGGLGGQLYEVTRSDDAIPPLPGMLRYGVESLSGPTWIVFSPSVFPPSTKKAIYLEAELQMRSDTTIDGRGSHVSLRRRAYLDEADWVLAPSGSYECFLEEGHPHYPGEHTMGPIVRIRSVQNVIITHLDFMQDYQGAIDDPEVPATYDYTKLDTQCFGDVISIDNNGGTESDHQYGDIWINHNDFAHCGDECIGITHPNLTHRAYLSISNNKLSSSYKGILLGGLSGDATFMIAASIYHNRFVGVNERQPRVGKAYAHVFNNVFEDWRSMAVEAFSSTRVMVEQNVFRSVSQTKYPWVVMSGSTDASLWARNDIYSTAPTQPCHNETPSFPACGSAWYYPCTVTKIDICAMSYSEAINSLRANDGWTSAANDVR